MALLVEPRKVVIGDRREVEAGLLGAPGVADQVGRPVLFRHQLVAELDHQACPRLFFFSSLCSEAL